MLSFTYTNGQLVNVSDDYTPGATTRNDFRSFAAAEKVAADATALTGRLHVATDAGRSCSPQFDVIEAPRVGDAVSKAFNGDYYPAGEVVKVSSTLSRVETSDGTVFYRRRQTGSWVADRTWSMVRGVIDRRNPSF